MNTTRIYSRAKINLSLDVLSKREDNYHEVKMVMQTIKLADIIDVTITDTDKINLTTNLSYLPTDERNIAYKACLAFFDNTDVKFTGLDVNIFKKIPVSAGLAGGSTNAAGVLLALNKLYDTKMSLKQLMEIGEKLGADVPFCIHGGTMLSEGIGEKLTKLPPLPRCKIVLCKPNFSVSTAKVYGQIDAKKIQKRPDTDALIKCLKNKDFYGVTKRMYNVLEDVTAKQYKQIGEIKKIMSDFDANGVMMSGSGPTVFGLFDSEENAIKATRYLRKFYKETHITDVSNNTNEKI